MFGWKKLFIVAVSILLTASFVAPAVAMDQGNKRKGKYIYRKVFKACYERGAVASEKPALNPDAKTQAEWTEMFEAKDFAEFGCDQEFAALAQDDLVDIYTYLHAHAADSPTPLKCK
ncbi:MAG: cytochrome c family protein [Desulfobacterales bacterium]|jgi:hypothetical protein